MHIPDKFLYLIFQIEFYSNLFPRVRFSFPTISFPFWIFASKRRSFLRVQKLHDSKTIINETLILFPFHSESSIKAERSLNIHTHTQISVSKIGAESELAHAVDEPRRDRSAHAKLARRPARRTPPTSTSGRCQVTDEASSYASFRRWNDAGVVVIPTKVQRRPSSSVIFVNASLTIFTL